MKINTPRNLGILLGVLYGLTFRLVMGSNYANSSSGLVSVSFMFLVPCIIGFIRVYCEEKLENKISIGRMIVAPWQPIFIFLFTTFITLLEGSICILIALPAFMFFASIGGLIAGFLSRMFKNKGTLTCIAILPLVTASIELKYLELSNTYEVKNEIEINGTPEKIWQQLGNVENIEEDELPISITSILGIPAPVSAKMSGLSVGSVRTSRWEKGVIFKEVITVWHEGREMAYDFDIDPDLIPDDSLDKHVKLGGEYFSPLSGKYEITPSDNEGKSLLKLSTVIQDNTNFGIYSRLWGELIFNDFHNTLLGLIKNRTESKVKSLN